MASHSPVFLSMSPGIKMPPFLFSYVPDCAFNISSQNLLIEDFRVLLGTHPFLLGGEESLHVLFGILNKHYILACFPSINPLQDAALDMSCSFNILGALHSNHRKDQKYLQVPFSIFMPSNRSSSLSMQRHPTTPVPVGALYC
jgi:hypothetical protein